MGALLSGTTSCVRSPSTDRLIIGLYPAIERIALLILALGLFLMGFALAILLETKDVHKALFLPGVLLTAASCYLLFLQPKLLFDLPTGRFLLLRLFRRTRQWRLEDVQGIEVLRVWKLEDLKLVLKNGERLLIFQTRSGQSERSAAQIAAFLQVSIERRKLI